MKDYYKEYPRIAEYISNLKESTAHVVWVRQVNRNPPHKWDEHSHDCHELMYYLAGKGIVNFPGNSLNVSASDLIYIPPGISHEGFSDLTWHEEMIVVRFNIETGSEFNSFIRVRCNDVNLPWLFRKIYEEYSGEAQYSTQIIDNYLENIILLLKRHFSNERNINYNITAWSIQYMIDNVNNNISVNELAQMVHMSISNFSRTFKNDVGMSPLNYFNYLKINRARELLATSRTSISDIARSLGYEDPLYFSRMFKKVTGISPSEYRKSLLKDLM